MTDTVRFFSLKTPPYLERLYNIFFDIKEHTDEIHSQLNDKNFLSDPSVDIEFIAQNICHLIIIPVPPEVIQFEHSLLVEGDIILLNEDDTPEEQRFSIAHEIAHFVLRKNSDKSDIARIEANPPQEIFRKFYLNIDIAMKVWSQFLASLISEKLGKFVSDKKVYVVLNKVVSEAVLKKTENAFFKKGNTRGVSAQIFVKYKEIYETSVNEMKKNWPIIFIKIYNEEIADYFAANLLVPTERFVLWEDKTDEEIAEAFKVTERCIQKRRDEEIEKEIDFLTPKNLSSDVQLEEKTPLSQDELEQILRGHCERAGQT